MPSLEYQLWSIDIFFFFHFREICLIKSSRCGISGRSASVGSIWLVSSSKATITLIMFYAGWMWMGKERIMIQLIFLWVLNVTIGKVCTDEMFIVVWFLMIGVHFIDFSLRSHEFKYISQIIKSPKNFKKPWKASKALKNSWSLKKSL